MPDTRLAWLVAAWLVVAATAAVAQERQQLSLGSETAPVTVFADRVENLERDRLLVAEGHVEVEQGDVRLEADRFEVNTETGEGVGTGKVVLFDGKDRLTGDRLEYNFRTATGIVYRGDRRHAVVRRRHRRQAQPVHRAEQLAVSLGAIIERPAAGRRRHRGRIMRGMCLGGDDDHGRDSPGAARVLLE